MNSLGLGGTNAFAVLEEAPPREAEGGPDDAADCSVHLLGQDPIGATGVNGETSLMDQSMSWAQRARSVVHADQRSNSLCEPILRFGRFAANNCKARSQRLSRRREDGAEKTGNRRLGFLFSGQGSQYAGMGKELYRSHPVFRATVDRCAEALRDSLPRPLLEVLFGEGDASSLIHETAFTQPALFVVQAALTDLWRSWGVVPDVVLGHSVGEFAAAYCAEVYTLEDCLKLVADRARLMQALPPQGTMASIFAAEATVAKVIGNTTPSASPSLR